MRTGLIGITAVLVLVGLLTASDARAGTRRGRGRVDNSPAVGAEAPDFELVTVKSYLAGKPEKVKLSSFRGKREVVLVLTSYT
ncbi:MAG: hypothetical protein ACYTGB_11290 [Planctomycetota bacterium]|jgi:hypothetical protein